MKIIDPHVDVADFYSLNKWTVDDFYSKSSKPWVTLAKMQQTGIEVIGLTLYFDETFKKTNYYDGAKSFYDFYQRLVDKSDVWYPIRTALDFKHKPNDKIGYFFSIEGFECFRAPDDFDEFYALGVRSFGLTWSFENLYASGRHSKNDTGITSLGKQVVARMVKKQKLIIDIAHLSELSAKDLEKIWPGMMVTTHGNSRTVCMNQHNLSDDEISIIVERKGVVSLFPLVDCVGEKGDFDQLYTHLDYIGSKWGLDYVAFSTDIYPLPEYPFSNNAKDITIAKDWYAYLLTRMKPSEVEKVMWGNWARVLEQAL